MSEKSLIIKVKVREKLFWSQGDQYGKMCIVQPRDVQRLYKARGSGSGGERIEQGLRTQGLVGLKEIQITLGLQAWKNRFVEITI